ncbi:hypothetical protein M427DRAFT_319637 [Gonapodya prolifera JEL478]|uniref:Uncharacterized protein n=1 Tax=Gonapodya prolifera (strain JEL478) TaxID=1344416 RepID=A0A139AFQ2_GONPJ|nr:hypothetical protein M427DRAFT_319637 [Gonapodya prolifera JEL478]|eukprot:KXS15641.1 hypothetical protein M427DRAFT_319637 [Gonapodya prolifera JEL478]
MMDESPVVFEVEAGEVCCTPATDLRTYTRLDELRFCPPPRHYHPPRLQSLVVDPEKHVDQPNTVVQDRGSTRRTDEYQVGSLLRSFSTDLMVIQHGDLAASSNWDDEIRAPRNTTTQPKVLRENNSTTPAHNKSFCLYLCGLFIMISAR